MALAKKFVYKKRTLEDVNKRANQTGNARESMFIDGVKVYKVKDKNEVRFLPPTFEGANHYGIDVWVHYGIGSDESAVICINKMRGEDCPVCEEKRKAEAEKQVEYAKALEPKKSVIAWIIDRADEEAGPQLFRMSWTVDRDICKQAYDRKTGEVYYLDDPEDGYDVFFDKDGQGLKTKYSGFNVARRSSPLSSNDKEMDKWLSYAQEHPLPNCLVIHDAEKIQQIFTGHSFKNEEEPVGEPEDTKAPESTESSSKPKEKSSEYTREDLENMSRRKLEKLAANLGMDEDFIDDQEDDDLVKALCEELGID